MKVLLVLLLIFTTIIIVSFNKTEVSAKEAATFGKCVTPSFQSAYRDSQAIFAGKVLSIRTDGDEKIYTFRVDKYWKGSKSKRIEVRYNETMRYQVWLQVGGSYLVYARKNENGVLFDARCSLTKNYSEARGDLKLLGKGKTVK